MAADLSQTPRMREYVKVCTADAAAAAARMSGVLVPHAYLYLPASQPPPPPRALHNHMQTAHNVGEAHAAMRCSRAHSITITIYVGRQRGVCERIYVLPDARGVCTGASVYQTHTHTRAHACADSFEYGL